MASIKLYQIIPHNLHDYWHTQLGNARDSKDQGRIIHAVGNLVREALAWNLYHPKGFETIGLHLGLRAICEEAGGRKFSLGEIVQFSDALCQVERKKCFTQDRQAFDKLDAHLTERLIYLKRVKNIDERLDPFMEKLKSGGTDEAVSCMHEILSWMKVNAEHPGLQDKLVQCLEIVQPDNMRHFTLGQNAIVLDAIKAVSDTHKNRLNYRDLRKFCEGEIRYHQKAHRSLFTYERRPIEMTSDNGRFHCDP
ncbi:MAG: hypothetical protein K1X28_01930 [Parachlamydiales bacterium]|nr:hypothetical protein [Parachlamydiales bacterium]